MKFAIVATAALSLFASRAGALQLRVYSPATHDRFTGFPSTPVANPTFLHAAVDLTGVGWEAGVPTRQFTLVSPRYFVGANHYPPIIGAEIRFLSTGGVIRTATVESLYTVPNTNGQGSDLLLGRLSAPVLPSSGVNFLRCDILDTEAGYVGQTLGVLGQTARGGAGTISSTGTFGGDGISGINMTRTLQFNYGIAGSPNDAHVEVGDSGSPSFVVVNGKAAVVGTHSALLSGGGTYTTIDTLVPAYTAQVNAIMEADGYHFTPAAPKSTTLSFSQQVTPSVIRAGYPVTIQYTLGNTGALNAANNVKLNTTLTGVSSINATGSAGWVIDSSPGVASARRGGLAANTSSTVSLTFTPGGPGTIARTTTWSADEAATGTDTGNLAVIESYKSWSTGLTDTDPSADDDHDGLPNLLEYAQGGDPHVASRTVPGTTQAMALVPLRVEPASGGHRQVVRFVRRTDAAQRLLEYHLELSTTLSASWTDVTSSTTELATAPLAPGLETADIALPATSGDRQFVRLRVLLSG